MIAQADTESLGEVLTEAYLSSGSELAQDKELRRRVLERVAVAPGSWGAVPLNRFPTEEVAPIANTLVGTIQSRISLSESYFWLNHHPELLEVASLAKRLQVWQSMTPNQVGELVFLLHRLAPDETLIEIAKIPDLYSSAGPSFDRSSEIYFCQAEIALFGLKDRDLRQSSLEGFKASLRRVIQALLNTESLSWRTLHSLQDFLTGKILKISISTWKLDEKQEFASLARQLADHLKTVKLQEEPMEFCEDAIRFLNHWADLLERVESPEKPSPKITKSRSSKTKPKRR